MKKLLAMCALALVPALHSVAQEAIFARHNIVSPEFNKDGSITFRVVAPNAKKVEIQGDFLPSGHAAMDTVGGVWTYTQKDRLPAELYSYRFSVDGQQQLDGANINRSRDITFFQNTFIISHEKGDEGYLYSPQNVEHGTVRQMWYDSPTLGMKRRISIYTPAGYEKGGKYPVMYLLHGMGGDEEAWLELGRTAQIMDNLIAMGKAKPMIVVMTNGNAGQMASPYHQVGPVNWRPKVQFPESFPDVQAFVAKNFRIKKGADNTAICGLSMGGYHTFTISLMQPKSFGYIGLFSAAIRMQQGNNDPIEKQLADNPEGVKQFEQLFAAKPHLYWVAIGKTDFLYGQNVGLRKYLDSKQYPYEYYESEGGHIWRNWRVYLTKFAQRLF